MSAHPENRGDDGGLSPEERAVFAAMDEVVDEHQAALERIADADPLGFIAFSDRDDWLDKRLGGGGPK